MPLPLPTLLSQALVAYTIELDNAFEQRMPNVTVIGGDANAAAGIAAWGYAPWLASLAMYANFLRYVEGDGTAAREVARQARITRRGMEVSLAGMSRWGYVTAAPDPADPRPKPPRGEWRVRPTPAGKQAKAQWAPLFAEIEGRWAERFGAAQVAALRASLASLAARFEAPAPDYMPIVAWALFVEPLAPAAAPAAPVRDLSALMSKALLMFALEYDHDWPLSLTLSANVLRVLDGDGGPVRELPRRSGVSKEAISMALGVLEKGGYAETITSGRTRLVRLTDKGLAAKAAHVRRLEEIEARWRDDYGAAAIDDLRAALEALVGEPGAATSPLFAGLDPPLTGWRARLRRPEHLPHHPMILHRGGYPDGA